MYRSGVCGRSKLLEAMQDPGVLFRQSQNIKKYRGLPRPETDLEAFSFTLTERVTGMFKPKIASEIAVFIMNQTRSANLSF